MFRGPTSWAQLNCSVKPGRAREKKDSRFAGALRVWGLGSQDALSGRVGNLSGFRCAGPVACRVVEVWVESFRV